MYELAGPHFVPVVILCTLHLAAGLAVGMFLISSLSDRGQQKEHIARLENLVRLYETGIERFGRQAARLAISSGKDAQIPSTLVHSLRLLATAAQDLRKNSAKARKPSDKVARTRSDQLHTLSSGEFHTIVRGSASSAAIELEPTAGAVRHRYEVRQWMGRFKGNRLPRIDDFEKVLCHDISASGVSFYCDEIQIGQSIVLCIGIGSDPMYVVAEVMHRRVVSRDDRLMYLAGCRFVRRLSSQTDGELLASYAEQLTLTSQPEPVAT